MPAAATCLTWAPALTQGSGFSGQLHLIHGAGEQACGARHQVAIEWDSASTSPDTPCSQPHYGALLTRHLTPVLLLPSTIDACPRTTRCWPPPTSAWSMWPLTGAGCPRSSAWQL
jgi:hypothetical protein